MDHPLKDKYEDYKRKVDFKISFEEFKRPKTFLTVHEAMVGTVLNYIDKNLKVYSHIIYFDCMLFFTYLTDQQIKDGPVVYGYAEGSACCF